MMEGIWLGVCCLSGWLILPTCTLHQYHFINQPLTWNEAQTYCRQKYTDLATAENTDDMTQLQSLLSSSGYNFEVWFGLYSKINWKWSDDFTGSGAEYRNWDTDGPKWGMKNLCVHNYYRWYTYSCKMRNRCICNNGTQENRQFVASKTAMTWSDAQKYCRENYVDLATVTSDAENQQIRDLVSNQGFAWIGLFRDHAHYWSDGSSFSWSDFADSEAIIGLKTVLCGSTSLRKSMKWWLVGCEEKKPFVCHGVPVKKQVVKLRIDLGDSSVDLNDPAVKAAILEKLQQRLKENGVNGVNLKWREQPDGKVFHKEEDEGTSPDI